MTKDEISIIGKLVKDMYGTTIGNVLGTLTHIDGKIQTVGIDCGSEGLKQIPYEQLVLQGDVVIYIPGWRIDAQKILREKRLTLSRLKALMGIMSENDATQSDADVIHDNLFIECKLRAKHSAIKLWDDTKSFADKEKKPQLLHYVKKIDLVFG